MRSGCCSRASAAWRPLVLRVGGRELLQAVADRPFATASLRRAARSSFFGAVSQSACTCRALRPAEQIRRVTQVRVGHLRVHLRDAFHVGSACRSSSSATARAAARTPGGRRRRVEPVPLRVLELLDQVLPLRRRAVAVHPRGHVRRAPRKTPARSATAACRARRDPPMTASLDHLTDAVDVLAVVDLAAASSGESGECEGGDHRAEGGSSCDNAGASGNT